MNRPAARSKVGFRTYRVYLWSLHTTEKQKSLLKFGIVVIFTTNQTMPNFNRLSENLAQNLSMNEARTPYLSLRIIALITAQSSNLKKIARHIPKEIGCDDKLC